MNNQQKDERIATQETMTKETKAGIIKDFNQNILVSHVQ